MNYRMLTILIAALLTVSAPLTVAAFAPDGEKHEANTPRPSLDWKSYPADIQALKVQLDSIRDQQKGLFAQMKNQHDQIREARRTLSETQRQSLKKDARNIVEQMKATRDSIHALRDQKRANWDKFHAHSRDKQWNDAKNDLQTIVIQKQQILDNQRNMLKLQQQLISLMKPAAGTHDRAKQG
ncbi:MAG: hypothetical protein J7559_23195 [Cohnella sp.]|nr:hypothetical protein [Cohnella sp.]